MSTWLDRYTLAHGVTGQSPVALQHAIVARELKANPEFRAEYRLRMRFGSALTARPKPGHDGGNDLSVSVLNRYPRWRFARVMGRRSGVPLDVLDTVHKVRSMTRRLLARRRRYNSP